MNPSTLAEALREAHQEMCSTAVAYAVWPNNHLPDDFCFDGHAAIDLVAKVAVLEQAEKGIMRLSAFPCLKQMTMGSCSHASCSTVAGFLHGLKDERDRLRREVEEAKRD